MDASSPIQITQLNIPPGMIDLGVGDPQFELLPLERLRRAAESCFARRDPAFLQYGIEAGDGYLRLALAGFLSRGYGFDVDPAGLFITNGASMALNLVCTLFTRPGDTIFVEEPSYFLALRIFADHHLRPVAIPVDQDGLIPEALEAALAHQHPVFLYTIPAFQNPSGCTLSAERRARLAALSREHDFLIIADEVYQLLSYGSQPPPSFASYLDQGNVISVGSFSKILAPGLRLGWVQVDAPRLAVLSGCGLLDSGGGMNPFTSGIVRGLLENGELDQHVAELRSVYGGRVRIMDQALRQYFPDASYTVPQGGYFFWARLPGELDAEGLLPFARQHRVGFRPGVRFSCQGGLRDYIRLGFAFYDTAQLEEGVARLGCAYRLGLSH